MPIILINEIIIHIGTINHILIIACIDKSITDSNRLYVLIQHIGFADLIALHVDFHNAEISRKIGIDAIHVDAVDTLVLRHRHIVEGAKVIHFTIHIHDVDV